MSTSESESLSIARTGAGWRLTPLLLLMVGTAHFNRISISVAGTEVIIPEAGVSAEQMGWVYSVFLIVYTLGMMPGGWFIDRFGPSRALLVVAAGSALFMAITGLAGWLWSGLALWIALLVIRAAMGSISVPIHPGAARLVGNWIAPAQQNAVNGMVNFAALVGIALTYYVFGKLTDRFGWTGASLISASFTAVLALGWALLAHDGAPRDAEATPSLVRAGALLRNRSLMMLTLSYAALGYFQYLFFYWAQYYFEAIREVEKGESRLYMTALTLAMGLGMVVGGFVSDLVRAHFAHPRAIVLTPALGLALAALAMIPGLRSELPLTTFICFAVAMAAAGISEGAFWSLAVEIGGTRGGLAAAILNTGGNAGGLIAPVLMPYLSAWFGWQAGFCVASGCCLLAALCWIGVDPRERFKA